MWSTKYLKHAMYRKKKKKENNLRQFWELEQTSLRFCQLNDVGADKITKMCVSSPSRTAKSHQENDICVQKMPKLHERKSLDWSRQEAKWRRMQAAKITLVQLQIRNRSNNLHAPFTFTKATFAIGSLENKFISTAEKWRTPTAQGMKDLTCDLTQCRRPLFLTLYNLWGYDEGEKTFEEVTAL